MTPHDMLNTLGVTLYDNLCCWHVAMILDMSPNNRPQRTYSIGLIKSIIFTDLDDIYGGMKGFV